MPRWGHPPPTPQVFACTILPIFAAFPWYLLANCKKQNKKQQERQNYQRLCFLEVEHLLSTWRLSWILKSHFSPDNKYKRGIINNIPLLDSIIIIYGHSHTCTHEPGPKLFNNMDPPSLHIVDHLKVIISNDLPVTDLFLPDDQTRSHLRSISRDIHYSPTRLHSSLPAPPVLAMVFHSSARPHSKWW